MSTHDALKLARLLHVIIFHYNYLENTSYVKLLDGKKIRYREFFLIIALLPSILDWKSHLVCKSSTDFSNDLCNLSAFLENFYKMHTTESHLFLILNMVGCLVMFRSMDFFSEKAQL